MLYVLTIETELEGHDIQGAPQGPDQHDNDDDEADDLDDIKDDPHEKQGKEDTDTDHNPTDQGGASSSSQISQPARQASDLRKRTPEEPRLGVALSVEQSPGVMWLVELRTYCGQMKEYLKHPTTKCLGKLEIRKLILAAIDKVFMTTDWGVIFPLAFVQTLPRTGSDHTPVLVDTGETIIAKEKNRFENCWLQQEGICELVKRVWSTLPACQVY